jgi:tetratricopeptide (TPR) repeat protein
VNARWLALGWIAACTALAQAQDKMPLPVEDDPNAPAELRGPKNQPAPPPASPRTPAPPEARAPGSPYSEAMVAYKAGNYANALDDLKGIDPSTQDDNFVVLKARILTELKRYDEGEKLLRQRLDEEVHANPAAKPGQAQEIILGLGDLLLHQRSFDRAAKYYNAALLAAPTDPDIKLKLIYARIGSNDLRGADQLASELSPFDPKNPYDDHAAYYFARAALAQSGGDGAGAEEFIQDARTNYGITITNRYLKTYLHFFATAPSKAPTGIAPK